MTREEREALSRHICNFYYDSGKKSTKTTANYFKKQNVPQNTIYYVLKTYLKYGTTKDLSGSGRPLKLSKKDLSTIVKSVNSRCALNQCKIARRFKVHYSIIPRNLGR